MTRTAPVTCARLMPPPIVSPRSRSAAGRRNAQNANEAGTAHRRQDAHAERFALPAIKAEPLPHRKGCQAYSPGFPLLVRNGGSHAGTRATENRRVDRGAQARSGETTATISDSIGVSQAGAAAPEAEERFQSVLSVWLPSTPQGACPSARGCSYCMSSGLITVSNRPLTSSHWIVGLFGGCGKNNVTIPPTLETLMVPLVYKEPIAVFCPGPSSTLAGWYPVPTSR